MSLVFSIYLIISCPKIYANGFLVSNVSVEDRNPSADTVIIKFDASWKILGKTKINHDAAWITVRLHNPTISPTDKENFAK